MAKKETEETALSQNGVDKPRDWDKAVSVAGLRLEGSSQEEAAERAGCARRSVIMWEQSTWWPKAVAEARSRWFRGRDLKAMTTLDKALGQHDTFTARWWADRRINELAPPVSKHNVSVSHEGWLDDMDDED